MPTPPLSLPSSLSPTTKRLLLLTPHHPHHTPSYPLHPRRLTTTTAPPATHYALFPRTLPHGPPPTGPFALDARALRGEYLQLQRVYHPDTLHRGSEVAPDSEPAAAARILGTSAAINSAYTTLLSPLLRAQYLLSLRGWDVGEDTQLGPGDGDAELLSQVLELREEIESAAGEEEVRRLEGENEGRIEGCEGLLGEMFGRDDLEGARGVVVRLRYWVNVREALGRWERGGEVVLGH